MVETVKYSLTSELLILLRSVTGTLELAPTDERSRKNCVWSSNVFGNWATCKESVFKSVIYLNSVVEPA